jgi:dolichol-phosphate mannosyltransferase
VATAISIIVPVFDEAGNILPLAREIAEALRSEPRPFEFVFVDDASLDNTWQKIEEARQIDPRVRGLRHARKSGQSAALWTGIQATTSEIIATLDGDLQNDPQDLARMLPLLTRYDFVCGVRTCRQDNFIRRISSHIARCARKTVLGVDFRDTGCALRVFKRAALAGVFPFNGWHRFLPLLIHGHGATTFELPVNHRPRQAGVSKYGLWDRLGRGIVDLFAIAWYQKRRLHPVPFSELEGPAPQPRDNARNERS